MTKIKVIVKRPESGPYVTNISPTLENLQKFVGGYIETVMIAEHIVVICDEEGRLKLKHPCAVINDELFVGDIVIAGVDGDTGELCDLPIDFKTFKKWFPSLWDNLSTY